VWSERRHEDSRYHVRLERGNKNGMQKKKKNEERKRKAFVIDMKDTNTKGMMYTVYKHCMAHV